LVRRLPDVSELWCRYRWWDFDHPWLSLAVVLPLWVAVLVAMGALSGGPVWFVGWASIPVLSTVARVAMGGERRMPRCPPPVRPDGG
jgi:hypothetical protein